MKRKIGILLTVLLAITILFACKPEEETRKPVPGVETVTLSTQGNPYNSQFNLDLSQASTLYTLQSLTDTGFHSCVACQECGTVQIDGENAYKIHNTTHGGFQIILTTPIKATNLKGMKITYRTDTPAPESEIRIYRQDDLTLSTQINDTAYLGGADKQWRCAPVELKNFTALAEADGYVYGFQLVMRNKNSATFYVQELSLIPDPEAMCAVHLANATKGEKDTVTAIAQNIQASFERFNYQATITVSCDTYLQNSTRYDGTITYTAKVLLGSKTIEYTSPTLTIPKIENQWLTNEGLPYGATQDTNTKWERNFSSGGILQLSKRKIRCEEGLQTMEYAIVPQGTDHTSQGIQWFSVQAYRFNKNGIQSLFINGYLDYGNTLVNGSAYTLYLRAVTNSQNYILHLQKDFTYALYAEEIAQALTQSLEKVAGKTLWLNRGKSAKDVVEDIVGDKQVVINIEEQKGYSGSICQIRLSYADNNFEEYTGEAFTLKNVVIWNSQQIAQAAILPQSPLDGAKNLVLASDPIVQYTKASYDDILRNNFESFNQNEVCTPPALHFTWTGSAENYILKISKEASMTDARTYETTTNELDVYNLETGTTYYWQVSAGDKVSPVATFTTEQYPRYVRIDGVRNMRDLGGYTTLNGKRVKQGLIYRSANFDSITKVGKLQLSEDLHIKTDLDFRGDDAKQSLGKDVQYVQIPIKWYSGVFPKEEAKLIGNVFKLFAKAENYPIAYHCAIGRDRTGTVSVLLLGLLGVDEETIMKEYLMTLHSAAGGYSSSVHDSLYTAMSGFMDGLAAYGKKGASFQKQVEGFLLEAGVTKAEINTIRTILLEE